MSSPGVSEMTERLVPLVGRDAELVAAGEAVRAERGVVVAGEAGVGKTRVLRELAARAREDGFAVETVRATDAAASVPFGALAALVPAGARSGSMLTTLVAAADALGGRHPHDRLVLVVDDAHRLDPASAALVLHLQVHGVAQVLAGVRTGERVPDAVTALWKDAGALRVDLAPLDDIATGELLQARLGGRVDRPTRRWAIEAVRGNPLYLDELVRAALDAGALTAQDGVWRRTGSVGSSPRLREVIDARLGVLRPGEQRALALVALAEPLELALLDRLGAVDAVRALEERGLVAATRNGGAVRMAHPLYGEAALHRLGAVDGLRLREELAGVLPRERPETRRLLATWALLDGRRDDPELLTEAATDALMRLDPDRAVALGRAAMEAGAGIEAALPLATALRSTGAFEEAEALLARYEDEVPGTPRAALYLFNRSMGLQWGLRRQDDALALVRRAQAWSPGNEWRAIVRQIAAALLVTSGRLAEGIAVAEPVIDLPDLGDATRLRSVLALGHGLPVVGRPREARRAIERVLARCRPGAAVEWPYEGALVSAAIAAGDGWDEAEAALARAHAAALRDGEQERATFCEMNLARIANVRGDGARARRLATDALERFELMDPREHAATCLAEIALAAAEDGDLEAARTALARCQERLRTWPSSVQSTHRAAIAETAVLAAEGDAAAGQRRALDAADVTGEAILFEAEALYQHVRLGGRPGTVRQRLARLAGRAPDTIIAVWSRHVRAAGDGAALEAVAAELEHIGARRWASEAAAQAVAAHEGRGDESAARRATARSRHLAALTGATAADERATRVLAALRPREREVAALLALRLTNAEIAERLSLSVRTVESHVYRATTRLGLRSRAELAAAIRGDVQ